MHSFPLCKYVSGTENQNHSQILVRYHRNISNYYIYDTKWYKTNLLLCIITENTVSQEKWVSILELSRSYEALDNVLFILSYML